MTVSVLITSYNQGLLLDRAINSALEQDYHEILIMDDGSTDGPTLDVLDAHHDPACDVRAVRFATTLEERAQTVRYATLLNVGAVRSTGCYLTFLSGDDFYLPGRLARMVAKIEEGNPVVYGPQLMVDERGQEMGVRPASEVLTDAWHRVDLSSVMMTREAFNVVGGFEDRPATPELWRQADAVLWRKLTDAGYRFVPVDGDEPTDCKVYREQGVDARVIRGETPWADS